ncbi:FAD-binding and (Fe-S)-binding domain-containing protein [Roseimarinus sediminis]|uniref:FAD-binding and (Fe-S)-binding domain-containing protein n=1 Tax=Roseimarinus sediminis TaxID=1610899 RepID=UPI003D248D15
MSEQTALYTHLKKLARELEGECRFDQLYRILYATDASAYREYPQAVVLPRNESDIKKLLSFARAHKTSLIPRGAGTSLAGQVVGKGIVVDVSKYMNRILEFNAEERWVSVEPGVVLSELNQYLKPYGLMFGPETSTANRCTMGGMLGNNSCGLHSLVHGSVREHIIEVETLLSDGSKVTFGELDKDSFEKKCAQDDLEGRIYTQLGEILGNAQNRSEIAAQYPHPSVPRRNNGYALDLLAAAAPFREDGEKLNLAKLLAGSEGTLAFTLSMKLNLVEVPPAEKAVLCVHFDRLEDAFQANLLALKYQPSAIELMDKTIMDLTRENIGQQRNRFFISGDPEALLIIELWSDSREEIISRAASIEKTMKSQGYGYHFPLIWGSDITRVWNLRKAGLGVLSNLPGDAKPVSVVEDTALPVKKLPLFLKDFKKLLDELKLKAVYHAHIATGELHLRPVLNLKEQHDVVLFRKMAIETARLVKKYRGSLSGEHGDGRLRGEFIPFMLGTRVYQMLKEVKACWDPDYIFNPGKITDTPPMHDWLRYEPGAETPELNHYFDYKTTLGMARAIEKCNGSADCRKSELSGGVMCPSFMVTRDELHSTRGRANILRELITRPSELHWADQHEVMDALDLCLSCKACKSECPSGVDMAKLKADFLQNHYDGNPLPFRSRLIAWFPLLMEMGVSLNPLSNAILSFRPMAMLISRLSRFTTKRPLPRLSAHSLRKWNKHHRSDGGRTRKVYLFNDEFLNVTDAEIGIKAILLLEKLGYEVVIPKHTYSGRSFLSKGLVKKARSLARKNVELLKDMISEESPLLGIEPSAILSFRDEYPELLSGELKAAASQLAENCFMFDEFIMREVKKGHISSEQFTQDVCEIKLHGHCHQKALATTAASVGMLQLPVNYKVSEIPSGCCGMAGSFGYEAEHYEISMKIGELVLFPEVRKSTPEVIIAAPGTSCRDQIEHGTGRKALHPVEILYHALK